MSESGLPGDDQHYREHEDREKFLEEVYKEDWNAFLILIRLHFVNLFMLEVPYENGTSIVRRASYTADRVIHKMWDKYLEEGRTIFQNPYGPVSEELKERLKMARENGTYGVSPQELEQRAFTYPWDGVVGEEERERLTNKHDPDGSEGT